jgi:hypothetical protein
MNQGNYQQAPKNKSYVMLGCLGVLAALFVIIAVVAGGYMMFAAPASTPMILINSPRNGERIALGQAVTIQSVARDANKIKRIELWVDGVLFDAQTSNVPGGISPFPLITNWQPTTVGAHTIVARAYNTRGTQSQATINIDTPQTADRDNDSIPDEADACPDQPGNPASHGCPDRDFDGIADASDACPDQAGLPDSGCPAPSEGDRDGDGMLDAADACPDIAGSPLAEGCIDTDGDGTADASDACPAEPGGGDDGCPLPGDTDADGVPDVDETADGGDSSSDPGESVEPLDDDEVSGEREFFGEGGGDEAIDLVRLEALEFSVTNTEDYDRIYCYAGQVSREMEHYGPFDTLGHQQWDIVEYMGGANSRTLGVLVGDPLVLRIECQAYIGATMRNLGYISRTYDSSQWDGHVIEELSGMREEERGDPGHAFRVKFRLCYRTCESADFPAPALRLDHERLGPFDIRYLDWNWSGEPGDITGFRLYVNDNRRATIPNAEANRINLREYTPACGETYKYHVTAYFRDGTTIRESPPSNSVHVAGEPCPRRVKVTFDRLRAEDSLRLGQGPIYGTFVATGANTRSLQFRGGECWAFLWVFNCEGLHFGNGTYNIAEMFSDLRTMQASCLGRGCVDVHAPEVNYVIVELNDSDDLTIAGSIWDVEPYGSDKRLFHNQRSFAAGETLPTEISLVDENHYGTFTLVIQFEELSEP